MIRIQNLRMSYRSGGESVPAIQDVSLDIEPGQFYTLLGPSGCGKTTTLRCVAGLEEPDTGEIAVGDKVVYSSTQGTWVPPYRRNIGMVFQSYAIWPHMSVFENVAFPLKNDRSRISPDQVRKRVLDALALVKLDAYVDRPAPHLSGGQQQRLALARALVGEPRVLLLDEPLSNLDAKLREEMRVELRELAKRLNVTTLFVTHEQLEALTMSDVVAVMKDGKIIQSGTPAEIYSQPRSAFVAKFIGRSNIIPGRVMESSRSAGEVLVHTDFGRVRCRDGGGGDAVVLAVRPEDVEIVHTGEPGADNIFEARVERSLFFGECVESFVRVGDVSLQLRLHPEEAPNGGDVIRIHLPQKRCLALSADS
ncbi:ABC transporter ATP-binding protein [Roseiarcaceae bacterium H3SJ34-1]|uniref:ABC transporter ATP-binding protein n=1 Tax=Terripilifer ovatus TaxID=3032367 RepID=UPI003AB95D5A|nr:ABC transporter ATP-binding protein [Roseiarcaceae bacterium H3SJ34-1]